MLKNLVRMTTTSLNLNNISTVVIIQIPEVLNFSLGKTFQNVPLLKMYVHFYEGLKRDNFSQLKVVRNRRNQNILFISV